MSADLKAIFLNARALAAGILVAMVLVVAYQWLAAIADGDTLLISAGSQAKIAAIFAVLTAIPVILVCIPIWAVLRRLGISNWYSAATLGLIASLATWVFVWNFDGPSAEALESGLPYGICGAVAGMACWWASPARRVSAAKSS